MVLVVVLKCQNLQKNGNKHNVFIYLANVMTTGQFFFSYKSLFKPFLLLKLSVIKGVAFLVFAVTHSRSTFLSISEIAQSLKKITKNVLQEINGLLRPSVRLFLNYFEHIITCRVLLTGSANTVMSTNKPPSMPLRPTEHDTCHYVKYAGLKNQDILANVMFDHLAT